MVSHIQNEKLHWKSLMLTIAYVLIQLNIAINVTAIGRIL